MKSNFKRLKTVLVLSGAVSMLALQMAVPARATEGYFAHGVGARNMALAGAGVADGRDATALLTNPAGLVGNGSEFDLSLSLFSPKRKYTGSGGPGFTTNSENKSSENIFAIPNLAYVHEIDANSSWGIAVSGNGGMNTNYRDVSNPACVSPPLPANNGVFCDGTTGVNLSQVLLTVGYAKQVGNFKFGVAPIFAAQIFEAKGLAAFSGVSSDPSKLTNNGHDTSTGFGGKVGVEFAASEHVRLGASYQSKIAMSEFDKYAGLFADGGDFDIPSNYQIGIAADITPAFTFLADYKRINYSDTPSVNNSSRIPLPFGAAGAAGFGWQDIDIFKVGAEWRTNDQWTLRAGYAHNGQPIGGDDVTLNILAPGVVQDHFSVGGAFVLNEHHIFEFALMYAPTETVSGIEVTPNGPNPGHTIDIEMKQFEATIGWKLKFGQ